MPGPKRDRRLRVGSTIDLAEHELTKAFGVGGVGTVTAITAEKIIVRTAGGFIHATSERRFNERRTG